MSDGNDALRALLDEKDGNDSGVIKIPAPQKRKEETPKESKLSDKETRQEEIAYETPQDNFRKILKDNGYKVGVETLTKVFFSGDTNDPAWLDEVLKLSNIPVNNRRMIITSYYGHTPEELGIKIEAQMKGRSIVPILTEVKAPEATNKLEDNIDLSKFTSDELNNLIKEEKAATVVAMIQEKRLAAEKRIKELRGSENPQPKETAPMKMITRPVLRDGRIVKGEDGAILHETIYEPVSSSSGSGSNDLMTMLIMKMFDDKSKPAAVDNELSKKIDEQNRKIDDLRKQDEIRRIEDDKKRLEEKLERAQIEYKKDLEAKEKDYQKKLEDEKKERTSAIEDLKERFMETIQHRKELDEVIGGISNQHKKETDELKKRLDTAQTSIERTVTSKAAESASKLTESLTDTVESVVKPMASVMKDHYGMLIDVERQKAGLSALKESLPKVDENELSRFASGE